MQSSVMQVLKQELENESLASKAQDVPFKKRISIKHSRGSGDDTIHFPITEQTVNLTRKGRR